MVMGLEILNQYWLPIILVVLCELAWKGIALWIAARRGDKVWYVVMLVVNSVGIVPIVYILLNKNKATKASS